jgi:hypothetical protein
METSRAVTFVDVQSGTSGLVWSVTVAVFDGRDDVVVFELFGADVRALDECEEGGPEELQLAHNTMHASNHGRRALDRGIIAVRNRQYVDQTAPCCSRPPSP